MNHYEDYDYDYHEMASDAYFIDHQEDNMDEPWDDDDIDYNIQDEYSNYIKEYEDYYHNLIDEIED